MDDADESQTTQSQFSFTRDNSIFEDRNVLKETYTPKTIVGRDEELTQFHSALQPVINNEDPDNVFLYGKSGVGKTATTNFLLERLREDASRYDDVNVETVKINCVDLSTSYQAVVELVNHLRPAGNQISKTGYPKSQVFSLLWGELEQVSGTVVIVLDEVDHIEDDDILYQIPRAASNDFVSDTSLCLIGISNDLQYRQRLSPKVRSSLCEHEIMFSTYDAKDLQKVIAHRAEKAFRDGVVGPGVVELCAAYGARASGDARQSIKLLRETGDIARGDGEDMLKEEHVERAREKLEKNRIQKAIKGLNDHEKSVIYALAVLEAEDATPARSDDVYEKYKAIAKMGALDAVGVRMIRRHLDTLSMLGISAKTSKNEGRRGGIYSVHELDSELSVVVPGLSEFIEEAGVLAPIQEYHDAE